MTESGQKLKISSTITTSDRSQHKKILVEPYLSKTSAEFVEQITHTNFFIGLEGLDLLIYVDNKISIRVPKTDYPFQMFPNVCVPIHLQVDSHDWQSTGFFSIVPNESPSAQNISLYFKHQYKLLPDITVQFPYLSYNNNDTISTIIGNISDSFYNITNDVIEYMSCNPDLILFTVSTPSGSKHFKAHDQIKPLVELLFDENSSYKANSKLYYSFLPKPSFPKDNPFYQTMIDNAFQAQTFSCFFDNIITTLLDYIEKNGTNDESVSIMSSAVYYAITNFLSPFICFLTNQKNPEFDSWKSFCSCFIDRDFLTEKTPNVIITSFILQWPEFISVLIKMTIQFSNFYKKKKPQSNSILGPIIFASKNISGRFSLLLTQGFIYLVNFEPSLTDQYQFLPQSYNFNVKDVSIIPVLSAYPVGAMKLIPFGLSGIFYTDQPFAVNFDDADFLKTFFISFLLSHSGVRRENWTTPLAFNQVIAHLSYPQNQEVFADIQMLEYNYQVRLPFSNIYETLTKLQKPSNSDQNTYAFLPSIEMCSTPFKFGDEEILNQINSSSTKKRNKPLMEWQVIRSILNDVFSSPSEDLALVMLHPFRISDFAYSFTLSSPSLLCLQIQMFKDIIYSVRISTVPLLHYACLYSHNPTMIQKLLEIFSSDFPDDENNTPIFYALKNSSITPIKLLITYHCNLNALNARYETPLIFCFKTGQYDKAEFLLQHGAKINKSIDVRSSSAIIYAINTKNVKAFKLLCSFSDETINAPTPEGKFITHYAIDNNFTHYLKLVNKLKVNLFSDKFPHPLHYILNRPFNQEIINDLLCVPSLKLNYANDKGETPLLRAVKMEDKRFFSRLVIDKRCDVNYVDSEGMCALSYLAQDGRIDDIKTLLQAGALIDMPNSHGETPLYIALKNKQKDVVDLLIKEGAQLALWYSDEGELPLMFNEVQGLSNLDFPKLQP